MSNQVNGKKYLVPVIIGGLAIAVGGYAWKNRGSDSIEKIPTVATQTSQTAKHPSFLFLSDVHLDAETDSTNYGGDTGKGLWAAFLAKVASILGGPDAPEFIVYTGDLPAHYSCSAGCYLPPGKRAEHDHDLTEILSGLHRIAEQFHKPLFYLPGNNDALAGDYYSFSDEKRNTPLNLVTATPFFFPGAPGMAGTAQPPCIIGDADSALGFYSAYPVKGLRLIALNTVIYSANFRTVDGTKQLADGNAQMAFLSAQLADAEAKNEKIYIAMHIPPGTDAYGGNDMWVNLSSGKDSWQNSFLNLADRYKSTIAGILYGHTHMDEIRRLYDTTGTRITEVAISCPGVTPQHNNNPGFKSVRYDETTMELMDFTTYYTYPSQMQWGDSTYSFSKIYGGSGSIYDRVIALPLDSLGQLMNQTFTVRNGPASYDITRGIEVKQMP